MKIQMLDQRGRPVVIQVSRAVIFMDDGVTPIAAAVDQPGGLVTVEQAVDSRGRANPAFPRMLEAQGLDRTFVLGRAVLQPLSEMTFRPMGQNA